MSPSPAKRGRSSFYWAMRLLPIGQRQAMFALYAYCRAIDDIADGTLDCAAKRQALAEWRDAISSLYTLDLTDPHPDHRAILDALRPGIAAFHWPRDEFLELIAGMEMDAGTPMFAPSWADLRLYCRRVAGAVGLLSMPVFGVVGEEARTFALALGEALQLTNILRDLSEDAAMGRLYLPREALAAAAIEATTPASVLASPHLPIACDWLAERAIAAFAEADRLQRRLGRWRLKSAGLMALAYGCQLHALRQGGWRDLAPLPRPGALAILRFALTAPTV